MNFKEKKQKLENYQKLLKKAKNLDISISEFEERAFENATKNTVGRLDKIRVSGGKNDTNKVSSYAEREEELKLLEGQRKKVGKELIEILKAIEKIENIDFQNAVYEFFVLDMSYSEMAFQEKISEDTAKWRRNKGIDMINF